MPRTYGAHNKPKTLDQKIAALDKKKTALLAEKKKSELQGG